MGEQVILQFSLLYGGILLHKQLKVYEFSMLIESLIYTVNSTKIIHKNYSQKLFTFDLFFPLLK